MALDKSEDLIRSLITQISRVAYALETIAVRSFKAPFGSPCHACGTTLRPILGRDPCPVCHVENPR